MGVPELTTRNPRLPLHFGHLIKEGNNIAISAIIIPSEPIRKNIGSSYFTPIPIPIMKNTIPENIVKNKIVFFRFIDFRIVIIFIYISYQFIRASDVRFGSKAA